MAGVLGAIVFAVHGATSHAASTVSARYEDDGRYSYYVVKVHGTDRADDVRVDSIGSSRLTIEDPDGVTVQDGHCKTPSKTLVNCFDPDILDVSTISGDDRILFGPRLDVPYAHAYGGDGDDVLVSRTPGYAYLFAGGGGDIVRGGPGDDGLYGGNGRDLVIGGRGSDYLNGDTGNDLLRGGSGSDRFIGGDGGDDLRAVDGGRDQNINCGDGLHDRVIRDPEDRPGANCERISRR